MNTSLIVTFIILQFTVSVLAYSIGRSNRNNKRKPEAINCDLRYYENGLPYICKRIYHNCKSGYCNKHCKDYDCNCVEVVNKITHIEKEILEEVRQITEG